MGCWVAEPLGYCDGGNTGLECTGWAPPGRATKCCVELQGPRGCPDWPSPLAVPAAPYWLPTGPEGVSRKLASGKAVECLRFSAPELLTPQGYRGTLCRKGTGVLKGPAEKARQGSSKRQSAKAPGPAARPLLQGPLHLENQCVPSCWMSPLLQQLKTVILPSRHRREEAKLDMKRLQPGHTSSGGKGLGLQPMKAELWLLGGTPPSPSSILRSCFSFLATSFRKSLEFRWPILGGERLLPVQVWVLGAVDGVVAVRRCHQ